MEQLLKRMCVMLFKNFIVKRYFLINKVHFARDIQKPPYKK